MARRRKEEHSVVVEKALSFIAANLSQSLSVNKIAEAAGYSSSRLKLVFKTITGHGILFHIHSMRFEKAKQLLLQTNLSILDIALEIGFGGPEQFARAFHKKTGMAPSSFRKNLSNPASPDARKIDQDAEKLWLLEKFSAAAPACRDWVFSGKFSQETAYATGEGDESFKASLNRLLPENFELKMEVQFIHAAGMLPSHLVFSFHAENNMQSCYNVALGDHDGRICILRDRGIDRRTKTAPPIVRDRWQQARIRLCDDTLGVWLDNEAIFDYRDSFPPRYDQRNRLAFEAWRSKILFRNLEIRDLGFPTLVRPARQGDSLYNSGVFESARDFYVRLLESIPALADSSELLYKIGMCHFAQRSFGQARVWLDRLATLAVGDYWVRQARLARLRIDLLEARHGATDDARHLFAVSEARDDVRNALQGASRHFFNRGFFDQSLGLAEFLLSLEEKDGFPYIMEADWVEEILHWQHRAGAAEEYLKGLLAHPAISRQIRNQLSQDLAYTSILLGKFDAAEEWLSQIRQASRNRSQLAGCSLISAYVLRGQGKMDQALAGFEAMQKDFVELTDYRVYAKLESALILCSLNRSSEARRALDEAYAWGVGIQSRYSYVVDLLAGNFEQGAQDLLSDSRGDSPNLFERAEQATKAAMLLEIGGNKKAAQKIWEEIIGRFPGERCAFFAAFAADMLEGRIDSLREIVTGAYQRSELFYLASKACEKRGDPARSHDFLDLCLKEDPSLRWPAYLAGKKLGRLA